MRALQQCGEDGGAAAAGGEVWATHGGYTGISYTQVANNRRAHNVYV